MPLAIHLLMEINKNYFLVGVVGTKTNICPPACFTFSSALLLQDNALIAIGKFIFPLPKILPSKSKWNLPSFSLIAQAMLFDLFRKDLCFHKIFD